MTSLPGWYGKIPSLGDFASRRLPYDFTRAWDAWLQDCMTVSREMLRDRWLDLYLTSPIWRFALMPDVCGSDGWAGLLMPSVDKVGRHFPLTVAVALGSEPACPGAAFEAAQSWYVQLEHIALSALGVDFLPEDLERQLDVLPFPSLAVGAASASTPVKDIASWWRGPSTKPITFRMEAPSSLGAVLAATADCLFAEHASGKALWWCEDPASRSLEVHCSKGLPAPEYFAVLLASTGPAAHGDVPGARGGRRT